MSTNTLIEYIDSLEPENMDENLISALKRLLTRVSPEVRDYMVGWDAKFSGKSITPQRFETGLLSFYHDWSPPDMEDFWATGTKAIFDQQGRSDRLLRLAKGISNVGDNVWRTSTARIITTLFIVHEVEVCETRDCDKGIGVTCRAAAKKEVAKRMDVTLKTISHAIKDFKKYMEAMKELGPHFLLVLANGYRTGYCKLPKRKLQNFLGTVQSHSEADAMDQKMILTIWDGLLGYGWREAELRTCETTLLKLLRSRGVGFGRADQAGHYGLNDTTGQQVGAGSPEYSQRPQHLYDLDLGVHHSPNATSDQYQVEAIIPELDMSEMQSHVEQSMNCHGLVHVQTRSGHRAATIYTEQLPTFCETGYQSDLQPREEVSDLGPYGSLVEDPFLVSIDNHEFFGRLSWDELIS